MVEAGVRPCGAGCGQRPGGTGPGHRGARALAAQPCLAAEVFQEVSPPARRHRARGRPPPEGEARAGREAAALCDGHAPHVRRARARRLARAPPSWPLDLRGRAGRVSFCTQAPEGALGAAPLCDGGRRGARVTPPSRPTGPAGRRFRVSGLGGQQSLGHGHTAGHGCPRASREPWGQFFRIAPWELKTKLRKQTLCAPLPLFPGGFNTGFF